MAQPSEYQRQADFSTLQAVAPTSPLNGATVDAEFDAVKVTTDEIRAAIRGIMRDDGRLANFSVGSDQLAADFQLGFNPPTNWATATEYDATSPVSAVLQGGRLYSCATTHTSGVFATDLAAGKWVEIFDFGADAIAAAASALAASGSETAADASADAAAASAAEAEGYADAAALLESLTSIDGGRADSIYTSTDPFDGGGASG